MRHCLAMLYREWTLHSTHISHDFTIAAATMPAETSKRARATIAEMGERFIRKGCTVLCHGHSRVAVTMLRRAAAAVSQGRGNHGRERERLRFV